MMTEIANGKKDNSVVRDEIILRAMRLWRTHGGTYSTCLASYAALLEQKRNLKIRPLHIIPDSVLKDFPDIPFLGIREQDEAKAYLQKLDVNSIKELIRHIEDVVKYHYVYNTVVNRVIEFDYQVRNYKHKNPHAMDPGFVNGRKGYRNPSNGRNRGVDDTK